jgi:threonine synthase
MDIQVSSNFERLLFEAAERDPAAVREYMSSLAGSGAFTLSAAALAAIRADFAAGRADEMDVTATIAKAFADTGFLADPHTAVGLSVASRFAVKGVPMVTLATAHPAKFPEAVKAASGVEPELPQGFADILVKPERYVTLANDQRAVEDHIRARASAAVEKA